MTNAFIRKGPSIVSQNASMYKGTLKSEVAVDDHEAVTIKSVPEKLVDAKDHQNSRNIVAILRVLSLFNSFSHFGMIIDQSSTL